MASTSVDNADREGFVANRPTSGPPGTVCPHFRALVELVGRRWSGAILVTLLDGPQFFRDLGSAVPGISDRLLSQRLRELESEGLVERCVHTGTPSRVSYALSDRGRDLEPAIRELKDWVRRWVPEEERAG